MSEPTPAECLGPGYCMEHEELPTSHHPDCPLFSPAQPPASGEPAEDYREELVKHCVDSGLPESYVSEDPAATARKIAELDRALDEEIEERDRNAEWADKLAFAIEGLTGVEVGEHSSANNPWRVALEAAEAPLPADWREAVEGALPTWRDWEDAVLGALNCNGCSADCNPEDGDHWDDCEAARRPELRAALYPLFERYQSALASLVLAERLLAERLREGLQESKRTAHADIAKARETAKDGCGLCRELALHLSRCHAVLTAADPPDAAVAELLGLPGEWEKGEPRDTAAELRAVLAKIGLPAGGEAGDG